jgi:hypothetical protein
VPDPSTQAWGALPDAPMWVLVAAAALGGVMTADMPEEEVARLILAALDGEE